MSEQEEQSFINTLLNVIETSNRLLNTYHKETAPGLKKDTIQKCIENNALAISCALEYEARKIEMLSLPDDYIGEFIGIPIENFDAVINLLNGLKERAIDFQMPSYADIIDECLSNLTLEPEDNG